MTLDLVMAGVIAFGVMMYVLLDGFDLGVGILFPLAADESERDRAMNSLAPIWDGNETWLVLGGAVLFGAFPKAFGILTSAFYLPIMLMLAGLVFRGVAFEYRFKFDDPRWWNRAFFGGSLLAAACQGLVLGAYVQGVGTDGAFRWFAPFPAFTALAVVIAYALLGACWIVLKTDGPQAVQARRRGRRLLLASLVCVVIVSLWTPMMSPEISARWFTWPNLAYLAPIPMTTALAAGLVWSGLGRNGHDALPLAAGMGLFMLTLLGLAISLWPWIVPRTLTVFDAGAQAESQQFIAVGIALTLPVILAYTAHNYWVFRGKVGADAGYH